MILAAAARRRRALVDRSGRAGYDPINQLSDAMREIGSDRLDRRVCAGNAATTRSESSPQSFDDLLQRLAEAFARERQFISDASHELKTPLTSINSNAQMLLRWADRDPAIRRESLETIARESAALADMVNGMLTLAKADRGDEIPKEPVFAGAGRKRGGAELRAAARREGPRVGIPPRRNADGLSAIRRCCGS